MTVEATDPLPIGKAMTRVHESLEALRLSAEAQGEQALAETASAWQRELMDMGTLLARQTCARIGETVEQRRREILCEYR